jgi:hypothetical protein
MTALSFELQPALKALATPDRVPRRQLLMAAATFLGALAPWVLLVTAYGGLGRSAAACFAGPLAI